MIINTLNQIQGSETRFLHIDFYVYLSDYEFRTKIQKVTKGDQILEMKIKEER